MTPGSATTEHRRAWRAEACCLLAFGVAVAQLFTPHWMWGLALIALALVGYVVVAALYSRHRSALKSIEARGAADRQIAELSTPRQRVV